ncbi:MAG: carboxypeptidase-like regulatory domain-containing protein, partial [Muribaculaceae bacterium]|nr:carboxypeptidase-like regulatory domain-containing protein [Muribaculaceae bacterium]
YGQTFNHYNETSFQIQLRYAPGEKFYQTKTYRYPINQDAPVFIVTHTIAPKRTAGNMFGINKTEVSIQKRIWFSTFGYLDGIISGGHVWSRSPYPNLLIPNANLSYTIQPESFALMNAMEFINDSYASWDLTYWLNGALFNYIPVLKKLKLREAISFRGLWGHLSHRNDPSYNPGLFAFPIDAHTTSMTSRPYMEIGAGIDNVMKILRVDYVWRLSYRHMPYACDRSGLRIALHFTF